MLPELLAAVAAGFFVLLLNLNERLAR